MSWRVRRWVALATLVSASALPSVAHAQSSDNKVAAEALFDEARRLVTDGKYAAACSKFEQSQRLDPGIGTLLYLADCYEKGGRIASAWATFREGASQAKAAGQADRASNGESRAAALEGRLSHLTLVVAPENSAREGFVLRRAGSPIAKDLWGVAVPVDGGEWLVEASAPGANGWSKRISVAAEKDSVSLEVPALEGDGTTAPPPTPPAAPEPIVAPAPSPPSRDQAPVGDTQRTFGLVLGGVGVIGVGFGSYFGLRAFSRNSDAKELCTGAVCNDKKGVDLTNDARDAATVSNVAFGIGFAALIGGTLLYLTAPSGKASALSLAPSVGKNAGGLAFGGNF